MRFGWLTLTLVLIGARAHAGPAETCADASEKGQLLRLQGKLSEARAQFRACVDDACPPIVRKDCSQFLVDLEAAMPTVVLGAKDASGDLVDVRVKSAGKTIAEKLDGKAVAMDPGAYDLVFESPGHLSVSQRVVVREGEKNRVIAVTLPLDRPATPPTEPAKVGSATAAWVFAGLGVVGLGTFTVAGLSARAEFDHLKATCGSRCPEDDVTPIKRKALVADLGLAVGVISAGISTWLFIDHAKKTEVRAVATANWLGLVGSF